jgi:malonyl-CoA O-methyltransferase
MNQTIKWLYAAENDTGGIAAWKADGRFAQSYPEVTGYILPTLIKWGAGDLAIRCADWLLSIQNKDGSFNGLDGKPRAFDTAAIIEGLLYMYEATIDSKYYNAMAAAVEWTYSQISPEGFLINSPGTPTAHIYNLRASAIIENELELFYWTHKPMIKGRERTHYLAYALEGLLNFGKAELVRPAVELAYYSGQLFQPFEVDEEWRPVRADVDYCASAQMAIIFHRAGLNVSRHYEALRRRVEPNGGIAQSSFDDRQIAWAAKYYLDLAAIMEGVTQ